jgi:hypothetical protein
MIGARPLAVDIAHTISYVSLLTPSWRTVHGTHTGVDGFAAPADEHQESAIGETGIRPAHRAVRGTRRPGVPPERPGRPRRRQNLEGSTPPVNSALPHSVRPIGATTVAATPPRSSEQENADE